MNPDHLKNNSKNDQKIFYGTQKIQTYDIYQI